MNPYAGQRVLVTGGLGFIGSNLTIRLVHLGAKVTIIDSCVRHGGGNFRNLGPVVDDVTIVSADIANDFIVRPLLADVDVIFNLAGQVSHSQSMRSPDKDLQINTRSQLTFLNQCAQAKLPCRIVYASTREVYGRAQYLPVDELHPIMPVDVNGVNKHAAGLYHLMWSYNGSLDAVVLRLTNVYGPRLALNLPDMGVLPTFLLRVLTGQQLYIYGDPARLRDPLYVDDAVDALLRAGASPALRSRVYNVGGPEALTLQEIAGTLCQIAGAPPPLSVPLPADHLAIDVGSFNTDSRLIQSHLGWRPKTRFREGARKTLDFIRAEVAAATPATGSMHA
jgi:UDP-glucose 4-epimerase